MPGGRPPKPTRIKEIEGWRGHHPRPTAEPRFSSAGLSCPRWLNAEARREWRRAAKLLTAQRVATAADLGVLTAYAVSYARWAAAERDIDTGGMYQLIPVVTKGGDVIGQRETPRPIVAQAQQYQKLMVAAAGRLGLDPSSRSKVSAAEDDGPTMAEILAAATWQVADVDPAEEMREAEE